MDGQCLQNQREPSASQHVYVLSMCAGSPKVHDLSLQQWGSTSGGADVDEAWLGPPLR